jgi:uncharacterized membrane-anchored protein
MVVSKYVVDFTEIVGTLLGILGASSLFAGGYRVPGERNRTQWIIPIVMGVGICGATFALVLDTAQNALLAGLVGVVIGGLVGGVALYMYTRIIPRMTARYLNFVSLILAILGLTALLLRPILSLLTIQVQ